MVATMKSPAYHIQFEGRFQTTILLWDCPFVNSLPCAFSNLRQYLGRWILVCSTPINPNFDVSLANAYGIVQCLGNLPTYYLQLDIYIQLIRILPKWWIDTLFQQVSFSIFHENNGSYVIKNEFMFEGKSNNFVLHECYNVLNCLNWKSFC